ncbi:hypothetical protein [Acinetobacter pittii]|uniref:hypothetical protein n=1 Tax=Acinetobacter pittii TaxID=48296 RepID=UPI00355B49E1
MKVQLSENSKAEFVELIAKDSIQCWFDGDEFVMPSGQGKTAKGIVLGKLMVWQHQQEKVEGLKKTNRKLEIYMLEIQQNMTDANELQKRLDSALEIAEDLMQSMEWYKVGERLEKILKGPEPVTFKVGDKVVNKSAEYLGDINEVSWISGQHMRLKGHDFSHVYVVDGFRHAKPEEIAACHRLDGVEK